jgi:hypothetical protein
MEKCNEGTVDRHSEGEVQEWRSAMREQYSSGLVQWEEGTIMDKHNRGR